MPPWHCLLWTKGTAWSKNHFLIWEYPCWLGKIIKDPTLSFHQSLNLQHRQRRQLGSEGFEGPDGHQADQEPAICPHGQQLPGLHYAKSCFWYVKEGQERWGYLAPRCPVIEQGEWTEIKEFHLKFWKISLLWGRSNNREKLLNLRPWSYSKADWTVLGNLLWLTLLVQGCWTRGSQEVPSCLKDSVILWLYHMNPKLQERESFKSFCSSFLSLSILVALGTFSLKFFLDFFEATSISRRGLKEVFMVFHLN